MAKQVFGINPAITDEGEKEMAMSALSNVGIDLRKEYSPIDADVLVGELINSYGIDILDLVHRCQPF